MPEAAFLTLILALPFLGSVLAAFLPTAARTTAAVMAGTIAVAGAVAAVLLYPLTTHGRIVRHTFEWIPSLDLSIVLRLDGLSWMFSMLVLGIGALVVVYARYYMSAEDPVPRFFSFLLAFMGSMLGVLLSGNLIQLVFFWELTSLFSFLLIGYWHQNANARDGARMALIVTAAGGLCLLLGALVLGRIVGTFDLDTVLASGEVIRSSPLFGLALTLVLIGAFTKSAQFPFHFWLPHAMAAPTPVSAYLHSATMVKLGIFLLLRLWPVMAGSNEWYFVVTSAGLITLVVGAYVAISQHDLKGLLAYSTISHLGLITLLLGLSTPLAAVAAIFHTINHATFKASLFMAAGIIDHETGTRDLRRLSGLYRFMPITATLAVVAAAAMAGVPLLNGFLSKEMFLSEALANHTGNVLNRSLPYLATLASAFGVTYSVRFIHQTFFGPPPVDLPRKPHEPPYWFRFPVELLVLVCLVVGVIPAVTVGPFLASAAVAVLGDAIPAYSLSLWHGFTLPLLLSVTALVVGFGLYLVFRRRLQAGGGEGPSWAQRLRARRLFDRVMAGGLVTAHWLEGRLGTRRLQPQLRLLVLVALAAGAAPFLVRSVARTAVLGSVVRTPIDPAFALVWVVGCGCAVGAAVLAKYHRLAALILMGGAGLASCVTFVWLSAPDLALTQLVVEAVTTVLLLLGLRWLPKRSIGLKLAGRRLLRSRLRRGADLATALAVGAGVATLALAVMTRPLPDSISRFFLERASTEAGGHNVVNVMLVDFRGFDTLGEITVLGIVALTVFALLRRFRPAPESVAAPEQQRSQNAYDVRRQDRELGDTVATYMLVPRVIMHWMFPVMTMVAIYLFLRGHDRPGGGFAAGVTMAIAFIVQYMAGGTRWVESRLRVLPLRWIGLGLLIAVATGAGALVYGYPFLTSTVAHVRIPWLGEIALASAALFDLGVFVLVVGATVLMLIALGHQSIRTPRLPAPEVPDAEEMAAAHAAVSLAAEAWAEDLALALAAKEASEHAAAKQAATLAAASDRDGEDA